MLLLIYWTVPGKPDDIFVKVNPDDFFTLSQRHMLEKPANILFGFPSCNTKGVNQPPPSVMPFDPFEHIPTTSFLSWER